MTIPVHKEHLTHLYLSLFTLSLLPYLNYDL